MPKNQSPARGLFSGVVLISVGLLLLLSTYGHVQLGEFFIRWWPLLIIFWGFSKLLERTVGRRDGTAGQSRFTGGEFFLVIGMLALIGFVVAVGSKHQIPGSIMEFTGNDYSFDLDVPVKEVPAGARLFLRDPRGDLTIHGSNDNRIRIGGKRTAKAWNESDADRMVKSASMEIVQNGDGYEIRPAGFDTSDARIGMDLEIDLPEKSPLTIKSDKGDISISDMQAGINLTSLGGDVEVRNTKGDVSIESRKGDLKITDTDGNVKISGKGGEVTVTQASGSFTLDGDFYGPVRMDNITKGVRLISSRTDLTLSALPGHFEAGSGSIDVIDAPGNLSLRTRDNEVNVENPGGKVTIDNRNANVAVRFTAVPKEDISITNSSAEISLTVPPASSFEIQADCHNCDIESEFPGLQATRSPAGDSSLTGKVGTGRGPKIVLKTSYGNIQLHRSAVEMPAPPRVPGPPKPMVPTVPMPPSTDQ